MRKRIFTDRDEYEFTRVLEATNFLLLEALMLDDIIVGLKKIGRR